jgi:hypothetical protein
MIKVVIRIMTIKATALLSKRVINKPTEKIMKRNDL